MYFLVIIRCGVYTNDWFFIIFRSAFYDPCVFTLFLSHFFHACSLFKIFGLLAAAVLGYDSCGIIKYMKNLKQQGATVSKYQHQHT